MAADWSIALGVLVYIVAIVFAVYYYLKYKKLFLIAFIASVATYIFSVFYIWDVFELNKNLVLLLLIISVGVMFYIGHYFSKLELKPAKRHTSLKEKKWKLNKKNLN